MRFPAVSNLRMVRDQEGTTGNCRRSGDACRETLVSSSPDALFDGYQCGCSCGNPSSGLRAASLLRNDVAGERILSKAEKHPLYWS